MRLIPIALVARALWDSNVRQLRQQNQVHLSQTLSNAGKCGAWRRWHREQAILAALPACERIARDVRWMFAAHLDLRDLTQAGTVGLMKAAAAYNPARAGAAGFESYAYWRVRGAIIDSQKRRTYREEENVSLQGIAAAAGGWLPPALDTDPSADALALAEREDIHRILADHIAMLPSLERRALRGHLSGQPLSVTARSMGRSVTWTRAKLQEARTLVTMSMRGEA